ncbi:M61 family metallopeptidase [Dokdonia donghaensis]|uniref:Peptidase M61 n=1 Tax=Dokdonia donghaensis DSW-1 TaxID=1300343 RepID=A0A0A2GU03_9FLAO|nr:PDZ domain-containing protein [Dokdonia donghaensis]ANH59328.1 M61 glycyl aminopeptidase [Dokdonia donghaensis DSW-1]KGO06727.1 peptidase M61 [Dokdonia donghaensis DSW-1]
MRLLLIALLLSSFCIAQTNEYSISFENAVHHEASIAITFPELKQKTVTVRMSRSSPGRYAIHEFAKNVFDFKATNSKGEVLEATRPDPYSWEIKNHDGEINVSYTLFANRADGTYSQIDESHAHLNMPATFMFMEGEEHRPIKIDFNVRRDLNWKVASQLKKVSQTTFTAPDLQYFFDSPTEVSDYQLREFMVDGQNIRFALHSDDSAQDFDTYWKKVKAIVLAQKEVFGELPAYDFGEYTFLACYAPHVSGDGMEHRNSTILTDRESLAAGGMEGNIGTVSHEFFHSWNVERIRPADLEPFDFTAANMSGSLWFAEGFTSYYTNLILARTGVITSEDYVKGLNRTFNYVWNSPARDYFNPIEMSYQAPFVDAATSVDPVNRNNTFISYYSYGSVLGLALDLSLRQQGLNLDDYFKAVWNQFGKKEVSYSIQDLENVLSGYAGDAFAKAFFSQYIYDSQMPDYQNLLSNAGLTITQDKNKPYLGLRVNASESGLRIASPTSKGSPAYAAKLNKGDLITAVDGAAITTVDAYNALVKKLTVGQTIAVSYKRFDSDATTNLTVSADPTYTITTDEKADKKARKLKKYWLQEK